METVLDMASNNYRYEVVSIYLFFLFLHETYVVGTH